MTVKFFNKNPTSGATVRDKQKYKIEKKKLYINNY